MKYNVKLLYQLLKNQEPVQNFMHHQTVTNLLDQALAPSSHIVARLLLIDLQTLPLFQFVTHKIWLCSGPEIQNNKHNNELLNATPIQCI